jgi:SMODS-associated and fused to various effectors sensor domain
MTPPDVRRSASGARQGGDDYQHLLAWNYTLSALLRHDDLVSVELEAVGAGNADDIVIQYGAGPSEFTQVRFAVDGSTPLDSDYLTRRKTPGGTSVLEKFFSTWTALKKTQESPRLLLVTNRSADPTDPAFAQLDGRTSLILPAMSQASATSDLGSIRTSWATHLQVDENQLIELLGSLQFRLGRAFAAEEERAAELMTASGLRSDPEAIRTGVDRARRWVIDGNRRLTPDELRQDIDELNLRDSATADVLIVQTLLRDTAPEDAAEILDWVDLFQGDTPASRRQTVDPGAYLSIMQPELAAAAERLIASGAHRILVRGAARLATQFAVGAALPKVRNVELLRRQGGETWSTDAPSREIQPLITSVVAIGQGDDLAIALAITVDLTTDVVEYLRRSALPVSDVLTVTIGSGPSDASVPSSGHAVALAQAIRQAARNAVRSRPGAAVHLFLACPATLALMIGHRWNRVAETTAYEDLGSSYQPAFTVSA